MAKVHVPIPLMHGETLNAKPPVKRKRPKTSVIAFVLPPHLPKKVYSVVVGSRVLPRTVLAFCAMKDDTFAPLTYVLTMRAMLGPEVPSSPVVVEGRMNILDSFEDDLLDDCENVAIPVTATSPFIAIEQRDMKTRLAFVLCRIFELEAKLAILKSEMIQLQRGVPNIVILDNNAIHSLL
nr:hypothetical protein CFP56_13600 [Quercus suber]